MENLNIDYSKTVNAELNRSSLKKFIFCIKHFTNNFYKILIPLTTEILRFHIKDAIIIKQ